MQRAVGASTGWVGNALGGSTVDAQAAEAPGWVAVGIGVVNADPDGSGVATGRGDIVEGERVSITDVGGDLATWADRAGGESSAVGTSLLDRGGGRGEGEGLVAGHFVTGAGGRRRSPERQVNELTINEWIPDICALRQIRDPPAVAQIHFNVGVGCDFECVLRVVRVDVRRRDVVRIGEGGGGHVVCSVKSVSVWLPSRLVRDDHVVDAGLVEKDAEAFEARVNRRDLLGHILVVARHLGHGHIGVAIGGKDEIALVVAWVNIDVHISGLHAQGAKTRRWMGMYKVQ